MTSLNYINLLAKSLNVFIDVSRTRKYQKTSCVCVSAHALAYVRMFERQCVYVLNTSLHE